MGLGVVISEAVYCLLNRERIHQLPWRRDGCAGFCPMGNVRAGHAAAKWPGIDELLLRHVNRLVVTHSGSSGLGDMSAACVSLG